MSSAVSGTEMIALARQLTGTTTLDQANSFMSDADLLAYLNVELASLYDLILENSDDDYYRGSQTVTLANNTTVYPLNVAVYKIISVDVIWSSNVVRSAKRFNESERNRFKQLAPTWSYLTDIYYRALGDNIEIQPMPQAGINLLVNYIPAFVPLTSLASTFDSVNQWHMAAVFGLCAIIANKDQDDASAAFFLGKKGEKERMIRALAGTRIVGEAPRVEKTRRRDEEYD